MYWDSPFPYDRFSVDEHILLAKLYSMREAVRKFLVEGVSRDLKRAQRRCN
jgi:hypothetical protein